MTRGRGEGSIRKRQDGRWEAVVQMGYFEGKRQRKSVYGRTRAEVNRKLLEVQALIATGVAPPPERLTVGRHLTDWLAHKRPSLRAKTYACYESSVRVHLVPALGTPERSLTIERAASSDLSLTVMLVFALVGVPIVLAYTAFVYWRFRGKVEGGAAYGH